MEQKATNNGKRAGQMNAAAALAMVEGMAGEGFLSSMEEFRPGPVNGFGRRVFYATGTDLALVQGWALAGLRSAWLARAADWPGNEKLFRELSRQHLPVVVHLVKTMHDAPVTADASSGARFVATTAQEAVDFALLAHRVAEYSLLPAISLLDASSPASGVRHPDVELINRFLGNPDDQILCPTPAQQMIFGKSRRRVPNWFSPDFPAVLGITKDEKSGALEAAAQEAYFARHLEGIIDQALSEFASLTGRAYAPVKGYRTEDADYLLFAQGAAFLPATEAVDHLRNTSRVKAGCFHLTLLRPLPEAYLAALLHHKKGVTLLSSLSAGQSGHDALRMGLEALIASMEKGKPQIYAGLTAGLPSRDSLIAAFENMLPSGRQKKRFFLEVDFARASGAMPHHEILMQSIRREYPSLPEESLPAVKPVDNRPATAAASSLAEALPLGIRRYRDQGPAYSRVSRFYHDTAVFYQPGASETAVADPFQALPLAPPATAAFSGLYAGREAIPFFEAGPCTGCGQCMLLCPHAALPSIVIGPEPMLKAAMEIAASKGTPVSSFTPLVRNLSRMAAQVIRSRPGQVTRVAEFLPEAFGELTAQLGLEGDKLEAARRDFDTLLSAIGEFPVAVTDTFFRLPEQQEPGSGTLFSLAVDPTACTGCGLCAAQCPENALTMAPGAAPETMARLQTAFNLWENLPDTPGPVIARLQRDERYNPLAALMLSRNFYLTVGGGWPGGKDKPAKTLLHLVAAVAEATTQPAIAAQLKELDELIGDLSDNIHARLSEALPHDDFSAMARAMQEAGTSRLPLDELMGRFGTGEHLRLVDTDVLQRKIQLVNDLRDLRDMLSSGPTGTGRSRYGLVLSESLARDLGRYPFHPFTSPALVCSDDQAPEAALGLFQGQVRHLLDNIRLIRRARLEAKDKYRPERDDAEIAALDWDRLMPGERKLVPPVLLVAGKKLAERNPGALNRLFAPALPVKVILLDEARISAGPDAAASVDQGLSASLPALASRRVFLLHSALNAPRHLSDGLLSALLSPEPALCCLLAPDPGAHTGPAAEWPQWSDLALRSGAFPLLRFDPALGAEFLSAGLSLEGNRQDGQPADKEPAYADWLFTQREWQPYFNAVDPADGANVPAAEYLSLTAASRQGKQPVVTGLTPDGAPLCAAAAPEVIAAAEAALRQWNTLKELAGNATPFPQKMKEEVERELRLGYERKLAELKAEYEDKLKNQEQQVMEQARVRLREKLLTLSRR